MASPGTDGSNQQSASPGTDGSNQQSASSYPCGGGRCRMHCCFCACFSLLVVVIVVVCGVLLLKVKDTDFQLKGARIWIGCDSQWQYEVQYTLDNPSPFSLSMDKLELELRHHSTGQAFATMLLTEAGDLEIPAGKSWWPHSGSFNIRSPNVLAAAAEKAVLGLTKDLLDVGVLVRLSIGGLPMSLEHELYLSPKDLQSSAKRPSVSDSRCFVAPSLTSAHITTWRGSAAAIGAQVSAVARTGACQPTWSFLELHLPAVDLHLKTSGVGNMIKIAMPAQGFNFQLEQLQLIANLTMEREHVPGATAFLQSVGGDGLAVTMHIVAPAPSSSCVAQEILAALPRLAEKKISKSEGAGSDTGDVVTLQQVSGQLGNGPLDTTQLQLAVSLSKLLPSVELQIDGVLPALSLTVDVERRGAGCSSERSALIHLSTVPEPLLGQNLLVLNLSCKAASSWSDALAIAASAACIKDSELIFHVHSGNHGEIASNVMSWWKLELATTMMPTTSSSPTSSPASTVAVDSSPTFAKFYWLLNGVVDAGSTWGDLRMDGTAALSSGGTAIGRAIVHPKPLREGLNASLELGLEASRTEVLQAAQTVLHALQEGRRPSVPVHTDGTVKATLPDALDASLNASLKLWPVGTSGIAHLELQQGFVQVDKLHIVPSVSLTVNEDWGVAGDLKMTVSGTLNGTEVALTVSSPSIKLTAVQLGIDSCNAAGGGNASTASVTNLQIALLGGAGPGQTLRIPCVFADICPSGSTATLPLTLGFSATFEGFVGLINLQSIRTTINTGLALQLSSTSLGSLPESVVATISLVSPPVVIPFAEPGSMLILINESAAMDLVSGGSWRLSAIAGPQGDFLGALFENYTLFQGAAGAGAAEGGDSAAGGVLEKLLLTSTNATAMHLELEYAVTDLLGVNVSIDFGSLDVAATFEGETVGSIAFSAPTIRGVGSTVFDLDLAVLAQSPANRFKLERMLMELVSDKARASMPLVNLHGTLRRNTLNFPIAITLGLPDLYKEKDHSSSKNTLIPETDFSVLPPNVSPQLFGSGCPCLSLGVTLKLKVFNPMWFSIKVHHVGADVYLIDPDGVQLWFMSALSPDILHLVDKIAHNQTYSLAAQENTSISMPLSVYSSTAWRLYDEDQQDRLTFKVTNGYMALGFKHPSSTEAFPIDLNFSMDSLSVGNHTSHCVTGTGGTCAVSSCYAWRNATCESGHCNCVNPGECAVNGTCVSSPR